jgi:TonB family protein
MRLGPALARVALAALAALATATAACGGSAPPPAEPAPPAPTRRKIIEDAEPEDGVQVMSEKGHLDPAAVDAALAPHRAAMTRCYTQKVGHRTWLGGRVVLQWAIAADGAVSSVRITESDLGALAVESCLVEVARQAVFAPPIGGAAELSLPLELSVARPLAASDDAVLLAALEAQLAKLDACAKAGAAAPVPEDVALTLYVGRRGRAESVGFAAPLELDDGWLGCAEKAAMSWRLPESRRQVTKLLVRYRPR